MTDKSGMIANRLLDWHDRNARQFPWRDQADPYRVWASEIMLQQTRAEAVIPYYERFIDAYPDVFSLAEAELTDVLKLFEGLGYYARFRNLHKAAKVIAFELGGAFPRDVECLRKLPGVGEYTAGAILSIAFGAPEPAIDANQIRVLARLFAIRGISGDAKTRGLLDAAARGLLSNGRPGDVNQALMGLGAMVCTPLKPKCADCCVGEFCAAAINGLADALPERKPKPEKRVQTVAVALIFAREGDRLLAFIRRRPEGGLLGGMWEFPCFVGAKTADDVSARVRELGIEARSYEKLAAHRHVFTHLIWDINGYACYAEAASSRDGLWVDAEALMGFPMSAALKSFRKLAVERLKGL